MATAAAAKPARKRLVLTKAQRRQIRKWRSDLGIDMWTVNDGMYDLRVKHREQSRQSRLWSVDEIVSASRLVEILVKRVLAVHKGLGLFLKRKELATDYRTRLKGAHDGMKIAIGYLKPILPLAIRERLPGRESFSVAYDDQEFFMETYSKGMKALRAAWTQLFYTTQKKDVRRFKLSADETELWHGAIARTSHPPTDMLREFLNMAEGQGVVIHVYDQDNELVYEAMPTYFMASDATSLKVKSTLTHSKKARQDWGYNWKDATPSNVTEFKQSLTADQKREVTKFLRDHPGEEFSISEVAALTDVEISSIEHVPVTRVSAYSEYIDNPGSDVDTVEEVFKDQGLHQAIWKMDLES